MRNKLSLSFRLHAIEEKKPDAPGWKSGEDDDAGDGTGDNANNSQLNSGGERHNPSARLPDDTGLFVVLQLR